MTGGAARRAHPMILPLHAAATFMMAGIVWFVQVDHYPLMARIGAAEFPAWERQHRLLSTYLMGPIMLAEAATAVALLARRPVGAPRALVRLGLLLVAVVWVSTAFVQLPIHAALSRAFDARLHEALVLTNWIRTAAWTLRAAIVLRLLAGTRAPDSLDADRPGDV